MPRHRLLGPNSDLRNHGRDAGAWPKASKTACPHTKLRQIALADGMVELAAAGMEQVLAGRTTLEEVFYKLSS